MAEWYFSGDTPITGGGDQGYDHSGAGDGFKVSSTSGELPVVFGSGKRYFGSIEGQRLLEDPHVVIEGDRVLYRRFKVRR